MELLWLRRGQVSRVGPGAMLGFGVGLTMLAVVAWLPLLVDGRLLHAASAPAVLASAVTDDVEDGRRLRQALIDTDAQMEVLAARLGELQGRLTRLESIGQQVGELAGFDADQLGFDQPVALGGPMADDADDSDIQLPELLDELREYSARLDDRILRFEILDRELLTRQIDAQLLPSGRPTRSGWLSSAFGYRTHPISGRRQFHRGVDLAGVAGDPVEAVASGLVVWSGTRDGYGNLIEIDHRNGYVTRYGHNKQNRVVAGELVKQGQVIATMGSTGRSTGPHVHFEVLKDGKQINPQKYLKGQRVASLNN